MSKIFDSHIHFNMKVNDPINDFKEQVDKLEGFILILNNEKEKILFEENLLNTFKKLFPLSAIAINYELANTDFIEKISDFKIKMGIKLHPRLSKITVDKFETVVHILEKIKFDFIVIDCFYYGSSLETHTNLELSIFIAKYFKDKKILLAHGGGHKVLEYMLYTRDLKNVYYDFSLSSNYLQNTSARIDIVNFIKFNSLKVFFGSDYPDFTVSNSIDIYNQLMIEAKLDEEQKKRIYYSNVLNFLNLEVENEK
jgi:predicted TIM-barrel fold metal-dependent hydrolase